MILVVEDVAPGLYASSLRLLQEEIVGKENALPVEYATTYEDAETYFSTERRESRACPRLVLVDMNFPKGSVSEDPLAGYCLIGEYAPLCPDTEWIAMTSLVQWHETQVEPGLSLFDALYFRFQLLDVYDKTSGLDRLESCLRRFFLPRTPADEHYSELVLNGESLVTKRFDLHHKLRMVAREAERGILIYGENGTGKDLFAKAIHVLSHRKGYRFGEVDGSSGQLEEMFLKSGDGGLEAFQEGSVYLSNLDKVEIGLQQRILRACQTSRVRLMCGVDSSRREFLEKHEYRPSILREMQATFVAFDIPSLEERPEDIAPLVEYFLKQFNQQHGKQKDLRGREFIFDLLTAVLSWPDNVATLRSVVEQVLRETVSDQVSHEDFRGVLVLQGLLPTVSLAPQDAADRRPYLDEDRVQDGEPVIITEEDLRRYGLRS